MRLKKTIFIVLFFICYINAKPDTTTVSHNQSKDTTISKIINDGGIIIYNKSDKDYWDLLEKFLPSILALAAIGLSMFSIKNQSKASKDQLETQLEITQKQIDATSVSKLISDLIDRNSQFSQELYSIMQTTSRRTNSSENDVLLKTKDLLYSVESFELYIPKNQKEYQDILTLKNSFIKTYGNFIDSYLKDSSINNERQLIELKKELKKKKEDITDLLQNFIDRLRIKLGDI